MSDAERPARWPSEMLKEALQDFLDEMASKGIRWVVEQQGDLDHEVVAAVLSDEDVLACDLYCDGRIVVIDSARSDDEISRQWFLGRLVQDAIELYAGEGFYDPKNPEDVKRGQAKLEQLRKVLQESVDLVTEAQKRLGSA